MKEPFHENCVKFFTAGHLVYLRPCLAARHLVIAYVDCFPATSLLNFSTNNKLISYWEAILPENIQEKMEILHMAYVFG